MANPIRFIFGYKRICAGAQSSAALINACMERSIPYRPVPSKDGSFCIECSLLAARKIEAACAEDNIELSDISEHGIPHLLGRYRKRYGIFVGALCFALIIFFSGRVLWDIRIDGARRIPEGEILSLLEDCGLTRGKRISELKADVIANRALIMSDDISWISVNLVGTVAHVEIRETQAAEEGEPYEAANLVADEDGEIVLFEEVRGNVVTEIGDHVRKGDLLVSGLYDSETGGFRYRCAKGRVLARTDQDFHIEIPLEYDKKTYTGESYTEKYLIFFNKEIKFYSNTGNSPPSCDTIDTVEYASLFSLGELPFGIRTVRRLEYEYKKETRTPESALELALYKLRCSEHQLGITDVLKRDFRYDVTEDKYILDCTTVCVRNIARQVEIEISGKEE